MYDCTCADQLKLGVLRIGRGSGCTENSFAFSLFIDKWYAIFVVVNYIHEV